MTKLIISFKSDSIGSNRSNRSKLVQIDPKWFKLDQHWSTWFKSVQVGSNQINLDQISSNELWLIWLGGGKGYFRHPSKLFYIKGIGVGQTPIFCHFWICWWTSFPEKLRPLRFEVAELCWGCWKQPRAHKKMFP